MSQPIAEEMTDNEALRYIVAELRFQNAFSAGQYDSIEGSSDNACSDVTPFTRDARPKAIKTVITNQGANDVLISENGYLVRILPPNETWVSPLTGSGNLSITCAESFSSSIAIATYLLT
jgi:hypothetical protein